VLVVTEIAERLAVTYDAPREQVAAAISTLIDDLCEHRAPATRCPGLTAR